MRIPQWMTSSCAGLILSAPLMAHQLPTEQIQMTDCLAGKLNHNYTVLAEYQHFKILDIPSADLDDLVRLADIHDCGSFVNVSQNLHANKVEELRQQADSLLRKPALITPFNAAKYEIKHAPEVKFALSAVDSPRIWDTLTQLTSFQNRSATKETGVQAAEWLKGRFESMVVEYGRSDTDAYFVATGRTYKQPSLVTVLGKDIQAPAIVIGAHMDTLDGRMPGAGDDGSGSSSVMEVARILLSSKVALKRPVYIIWYAAEERGLVGSQYVVKDFQKKKIPVAAAIQFDMTGYRNDPEDKTIWVFRDYTDKALSNFMVDLIKTYVDVPVDYSRCGYGCSDHASWMEIGVPAAFPCETSFDDHNPYIHTPNDTMSLISLDHMTNFTKLGIAFALELGLE